MLQLTVLYGYPQDPSAFNRHYRETHAPLARKIPGLLGFTITHPTSLDPQERSPYYLIANLYFANMEVVQRALASAEGQAAAGDLQNFATGGASLVIGEIAVYDPVSLR